MLRANFPDFQANVLLTRYTDTYPLHSLLHSMERRQQTPREIIYSFEIQHIVQSDWFNALQGEKASYG